MQKVTIKLPNQYQPKTIELFFPYKQIFVLLPRKVLKWSSPFFRRDLFVDNITDFLPNTKYTDTYKE